MHPDSAQTRARAIVIAVATITIGVMSLVALSYGGTGSGRSAGPGPATAAPEPDPWPYQQIPWGLCHRMRVEEVAQRFDLSMAPWYERTSDYHTERKLWYERCRFEGWAEDGRYATEFQDFQPTGAVEVEVYHELADAQEAYDQVTRNDFEFRADRLPNATTADIAGWWDMGMSLEWAGDLAREESDLEDIEFPQVAVEYVIRHENLVVRGNLTEHIPAEDIDEVLALLHDLKRVLIDEVVEHLTLTTE